MAGGNSLVQQSAALIENKTFGRFVTFVILLAAVLAGIETYPDTAAKFGSSLAIINMVILGVFIVEIVARYIAVNYSVTKFFGDGWNVFDFIIVVASLPFWGGANFAALRLFRLVRVLRLMRALPRLQILVNAMLKSFKSITYVAILMILMLYVYAVAGVIFFRDVPGLEDSFGTLGAALVSLTQAVTLEPWLDFFEPAYEHSKATALIYWVSFVIIDAMVILNLFVGIVIASMEEAKEERAEERAERSETRIDDELLKMRKHLDELHAQAGRVFRLAQEEEKARKAAE